MLQRRLSWVLAPLCKSSTNTCIIVTYSACKGTYSNKGGFWSFLILWVPWSGLCRASKGNVSCCFAPVSLPSVCLLVPNAFFSHESHVSQQITATSCSVSFLASSRGEKAPCSGNAALNIFTLKIDRIFARRNAACGYLFRSRQREIHRGGACKNMEKTALKSVQVESVHRELATHRWSHPSHSCPHLCQMLTTVTLPSSALCHCAITQRDGFRSGFFFPSRRLGGRDWS